MFRVPHQRQRQARQEAPAPPGRAVDRQFGIGGAILLALLIELLMALVIWLIIRAVT